MIHIQFLLSFSLTTWDLQESGTKSHFHDNNLIITVLNLFAAGTDTTATTLRWALLFMAKYPHVQGRMLGGQQKVRTSSRQD